MAYIHSSDKHLGGNIYLAASCLINRKYRDKALDVAVVVNRSIDAFRKYLDFPKDIEVRIAPLKGKINGRYCSAKVLELDCRLPWDKALEVLAHELVHAEQYKQGRLENVYTRGRGWTHRWNGEKNLNKGSTYRAYRNQPWEQEAWGRQAELAEKVCTDLEKLYE